MSKNDIPLEDVPPVSEWPPPHEEDPDAFYRPESDSNWALYGTLFFTGFAVAIVLNVIF